MKFSNLSMVALTILFLTLGFQALKEAQPTKKNERVYKELKQYMPFYLEKRIGGFSICSKEDNIKEKPPITEVYHRLEQLEQGWGKKHLKLENNELIILDNNKKQIGKIILKTKDELQWVKQFFGIGNIK